MATKEGYKEALNEIESKKLSEVPEESKPIVNQVSFNIDAEIAEKFRSLYQKTQQHDLMSKTKRSKETAFNCSGLGSMIVTLDEIQAEISNYNSPLSESELSTSFSEETSIQPQSLNDKISSPFIKLILCWDEDILLYEQNASTALRGSDDGSQVEEANERYDFLTMGEGRLRHRQDAETQTVNRLHKTRAINTDALGGHNVASYVSIFEMFDTFKRLDETAKRQQAAGERRAEKTSYRRSDVDPFVGMSKSSSFQLSLMLMTRVLAGNVYMQSQRRFRSMITPDPLALDAKYRYRLDKLWHFRLRLPSGAMPAAVSDLSWCHSNGDVLAAAYGIYTGAKSPASNSGHVCIWNIKNPVNPERYHCYPETHVTAVEFSTVVPQLLAIGLHDGSVEVRDISDSAFQLVGKAKRTNFDPVVAFRWIKQQGLYGVESGDFDTSKIQDFLTLRRNGVVTKYRFINGGPFLHGCQQQRIDRVEHDSVESAKSGVEIQVHRQVQGMNLALHPLHANLFYVLTDEGCVHKCSIQHPEQHVEVYEAHAAAVNSMDFSPILPKVFLTCSNDWCIRIWIDGISESLLTLSNNMQPIHCAYWSKTHSTIIVAVNRRTVDIWDIRRNTLKPVSSNRVGKSWNTELKFSNCGRSVAVGNEDGDVNILAFEDMPFPAHFQLDELKSTLASITNNSALKENVKKHVKKILELTNSTNSKYKRRK